FLYSSSSHKRNLHSFPTRRSSDLFMSRQRTRMKQTSKSKPERPSSGRSGFCFLYDARRTKRLIFLPEMNQSFGSSGIIEKAETGDRKSTRLNSSHDQISYAVFCLK